MKLMRTVAFLLIFTLIMPLYAVADNYINRGQVADMLLLVADYYNPDLKRSDIIKGYEDGQLHEERNVTRAEALVMLKRAFGSLPLPKGHNKRVALSYDDFSDIPAWAEDELEVVFDSGIAAGTARGVFSPDAYVTREQMQLFISRVYSLYGTNLKDDFYAAVNKEELENMELIPGNNEAGPSMDLQVWALLGIDGIITELTEHENEKGTREQKLADFYNCILDIDTRNKEGVNPIRKYLEKIDSVKNITELTGVHNIISEELCMRLFVEFSLSVDLNDSSKTMLLFETMSPLMEKDVYEDKEKSREYIAYLRTLLTLSGEAEDVAKENANIYFEFEKLLAQKMLDLEEQQNLEKIYNINSYSKISMLFPDFDLEKVLADSFLVKDDRVLVQEMALMQEFATLYNQSNLAALKTALKIQLIESVRDMLNTEFLDARRHLNYSLYGIESQENIKSQALAQIQLVMPEYLSQIYGERYFDKSSEEYIQNMTSDIINVFQKRIDNLSWMCDETKENAKKKLKTLEIKVGYQKMEKTYLDDVTIVPTSEGGTYFNNFIAIRKAALKAVGELQSMPVNHDSWVLDSYEVNANYNPTSNDIEISASILAPPFYSASAFYEENLGGIGFVIAHEITHAFDLLGANFDENGNVNFWWTERDYSEFEKLCADVVKFFDGVESIPAVRNNGYLTMNENIADLGAAACITDLAKEKGLDLKKVYISAAKSWVGTSTREYATFLSETDTHSNRKLRINRVLVNLKEFYDAFEITENDGMYVAPEERVLIW